MRRYAVDERYVKNKNKELNSDAVTQKPQAYITITMASRKPRHAAAIVITSAKCQSLTICEDSFDDICVTDDIWNVYEQMQRIFCVFNLVRFKAARV